MASKAALENRKVICSGRVRGYICRVISLLEQKLKVQQVYVAAMILGTSLVVGYMSAVSPYLLVLGAVATGLVMALPFHAKIAIALSMATFTSAFIIPITGRMFFWEFAGLLAWSGLVVMIALRQYNPDFWDYVRRNRWVFIGIGGYCAVLVVIMFHRGVGLRILGSSQMGGRFYFQQMICAIFPLLFIMVPLKEKTLVNLFFLQCALSGTYLISDFAFTYGGGLSVLLNFFELPGDAINFEMQSMNFGLRRFQSLGIIGQAFIFAVFIFFQLRDFYSRKGLILLPLCVAIFALGLYSGHRWVIVTVGLTTLFCAYTQRFFTIKNVLISIAILALTVLIAYGFAREMPLTIQRALSVLPGIEIDNQARVDGSSTLETRRLLRKVGWEMIPDYFWVGRGFGMSSQVDFSSLWEPTGVTAHINAAKFYNGLIGLMINTGIFGTFFMLMFMLAGTWQAWKIIRFLRRHGCEDMFSRTCCVVTAMWMANVIAFIFIHGDSEFAMKTFALQAGVMMACHRLLERRLRTEVAPA
jgi:O-antigen ligase